MVGSDKNRETLKLIYETNDSELLDDLALHQSMIIRRAVSRNKHTSKKAINKLACDPVQNVSYMALQHKNCTIVRKDFDGSHVCVSCTKDERTMDCHSCNIEDSSILN